MEQWAIILIGLKMATPKKKNPQKTGRKAWFNPNKPAPASILRKIEALAAQGINKRHCALTLGVTEETFYKYSRSHPELTEAYDKGCAMGMVTITSVLFNKAKLGESWAVQKFLKAQDPDKWGDNAKVDNVSSDGSMTPKVIRRIIVEAKDLTNDSGD